MPHIANHPRQVHLLQNRVIIEIIAGQYLRSDVEADRFVISKEDEVAKGWVIDVKHNCCAVRLTADIVTHWVG